MTSVYEIKEDMFQHKKKYLIQKVNKIIKTGSMI